MGAAAPVSHLNTAGAAWKQQVAFFYKNYISKVVFYSHELKLKTVFKQFSSNLNLKFLSETLSTEVFCFMKKVNLSYCFKTHLTVEPRLTTTLIINTVISLLWPLIFVPEKRKTIIFS
jgi:hypothetical protein